MQGSPNGFSVDQSIQQPINNLGSSVVQQGGNFGPLNTNFGGINPLNFINPNQKPFNNQFPFNNVNPQDSNPIPLNNYNTNPNPFNNNNPNPFNNNNNQLSNEIFKLRSINRSFDGTGNNLKNPRWGATGSAL